MARDPRLGAAALGDALGGLPWVVRARRVLPPHVERALRQLERSSTTG